MLWEGAAILGAAPGPFVDILFDKYWKILEYLI